MKKTIYKSDKDKIFKTITDIKPKPLTIEQLCDTIGYEMVVYDDSKLESKHKDEKWHIDLEETYFDEVRFSGYGSTQLKAMSNLVDEINKSEKFDFEVTLGRKGWIKRITYK